MANKSSSEFIVSFHWEILPRNDDNFMLSIVVMTFTQRYSQGIMVISVEYELMTSDKTMILFFFLPSQHLSESLFFNLVWFWNKREWKCLFLSLSLIWSYFPYWWIHLKRDHVNITSNITSIGIYAFYDCTSLVSISHQI